MTRRLADIARGVTALAAIAVLLVAVPYVLWRFGSVPVTGIIDAFRDPLASDETRNEQLLSGLLLVIAWACWAQVAYALLIEAVAAISGRAARRAPILPGIQTAAARLIATASLTLTTLTPTVTVVAAPLLPLETAHAAPAPGTQQFEQATDTTAPDSAPDGTTQSYVVGERDTFWSIAETTLGDGLRWQEVRDANIGSVMDDGTTVSPNTEATRPGWKLQLPAEAVLPVTLDTEPGTDAEAAAELAAMIQVEEGDHFWSLAEETLHAEWGRAPSDAEIAPFWAEMVTLNQDRLLPPEDPDLIYPDQRFQLPPIPADPIAPPAIEPAPEPPVTETPPTNSEQPPPPPTTQPPNTTATPTPAPTATTADTAPTSEEAQAAPAPTGAAGAPATDPGNPRSATTSALAAGIGALAVATGAIAVTLRRRRAHQAAKRPPETTIEPPSPQASDYERRIRPIADTEAARWVEATNQLITHRLAQHPEARLPALTAIRAGRHGVEILLDQPCAPVDGFVSGNDQNTAWRLHPDLELRMLEAETTDAQPYSPALTCLGTTEAGDLFIDLEQLAAISIDGDPDLVTGWFRSIALGVAANPWSQHCETIALGLPDDFANIDRVHVPADPTAWCEQTGKAMRKLHERLQATPYEQRINPGEIYHPTIVLAGPDHPELARQLAEVAALTNTPLAVLAATPLADAERVHLHADSAILEPAGIEFTPAITELAEAEVVTELLDNAALAATVPAEKPKPADSGGEAEAVETVIARITDPQPIEVKILVPVPTVEGLDPDPTTKQLAVIAYLAYHRTVSSSRLRETFWPTATNRSTADNAISQIRRLLGTDADGGSRLTQAINTGQYELSGDIACDWHRAQQLIAAADASEAGDACAMLRVALELVDGQVGADAPAQQFSWLIDDHAVYGTIETTLVDAADRLGKLALENGDVALAEWAAAQGLRLVPGNEAMYRLQMRAAAAAGESKAVKAAYDQAQRSAMDLGAWVEIDEETATLYDEITGRPESQAS